MASAAWVPTLLPSRRLSLRSSWCPSGLRKNPPRIRRRRLRLSPPQIPRINQPTLRPLSQRISPARPTRPPKSPSRNSPAFALADPALRGRFLGGLWRARPRASTRETALCDLLTPLLTCLLLQGSP